MSVPKLTAEDRINLEGVDVVVASVSGGKDSLAMSLWLKENDVEHERVYCDPGWEFDEHYAYLDYLREKLGPIHVVERPGGMKRLVVERASFASRKRRFCTEELKLKPLAAYIANHHRAGREVVNAVGVRAQESSTRAKMPRWEEQDRFQCMVWNPILSMAQDEVFDLIKRHGIKRHPMYDKGFDRVGCAPCVLESKQNLVTLGRDFPERVQEVRDLEEAVIQAWEAKGHDRTKENPPAFFQIPTRNSQGKRPCLPIDTILEWANAPRGKFWPKYEDEDPNIGSGCYRHGLCEVSPTHGNGDET